MLDALPDLIEAADKLLGLLVPVEPSESSFAKTLAQLHTKGSRVSHNWRRLGNTFQAQRDLYGSDSYIDPLGAIKILLGTKRVSAGSAGPWRPDALLQKANLAVLASSILSHPWQEQADQFIEELEQLFPKPLTEALVSSDTLMPGTSVLAVETFQYALELRTQYAIMQLARVSGQPNFDWDIVIQQAFLKDENELKGWGIAGLRSEDLTKEVLLSAIRRVEQLREAFKAYPEKPAAAVERLRTDFPWTGFVFQTVTWISQRFKEVETQITLNGGAAAICQSLNGEIQRSRLAQASINDDDDGDSPQLEFNYEPPSEASHTASEQQDIPFRSSRTSVLNLGQFR